MREHKQPRPDLTLLLSLLLVTLMFPVLDHGYVRKLILVVLFFVPVIVATVRMSQIKTWVWPSILLMSGALIFGVASTVFPNRVLLAIKWGILAAFFGVSVVGLFSYLKNARSIISAHLYTAVSIYLLLGMQWFALYSAIDVACPGSFQYSGSVANDRQSELLYFSLVTLSTIGYGDIVPLDGEVRILAALEGITGVLYVAITVALLVNSYRRQTDSK